MLVVKVAQQQEIPQHIIRKQEDTWYLDVFKSRPYFCHEQALVLGTFSFLYYFQQKNISTTSSRSSLKIELKVKAKLKSSQNDSTHSEALSSLGLPGVPLSPEGVWRDIFSVYWPRQEAKGLAWAPCPGQPHSGPRSPELPAEDLPTLEAQDGPPQRAPGCRGPLSGEE